MVPISRHSTPALVGCNQPTKGKLESGAGAIRGKKGKSKSDLDKTGWNISNRHTQKKRKGGTDAHRAESVVIARGLQASENILGPYVSLFKFSDVMPTPHALSRVLLAGRRIRRRILTPGEFFIRNEAQSLELGARRRHHLNVIVKKRKVDEAQTIVMSLIFWWGVDSMDGRLDVALRDISGGKKRSEGKERKQNMDILWSCAT